MTEAAIKDATQVYAIFGLACAFIMMMRETLIQWKKPVTGNVLGLVCFSSLAAELVWTLMEFHGRRALGLCGPMLIFSLFMGYHFMTCLRDLVPKTVENQ